MNIELISLVLNLIFGGGLILSLVTMKAQKHQAEASARGAEAQAESTEIDNADKVAKMWREYAEASEERYKATIENLTIEMGGMRERMNQMDITIRKLTTTNNQILKILKEINHDNLEQKKEEAGKLAGAPA